MNEMIGRKNARVCNSLLALGFSIGKMESVASSIQLKNVGTKQPQQNFVPQNE